METDDHQVYLKILNIESSLFQQERPSHWQPHALPKRKKKGTSNSVTPGECYRKGSLLKCKCTAFAEDPSSVPSTQFQKIGALFWP